MDLKKDLQNLASQSRTSQPDITKSFDQSIDDLSRSGVATRALGIGNQAPDFELPSCKGSRVRLSDRLATGPVVISFYRGAWCPFCTLEIQALGESVKTIEDLGASLLAISPQSLEAACKTAEDNGIPFDLLSDERNDVAREFGIVFHLQDEIQSIYKEFGLDLALVNGMTASTFRSPPLTSWMEMAQSGSPLSIPITRDASTHLKSSIHFVNCATQGRKVNHLSLVNGH
jgi:peroxiredoxin